MLSAGSHTFTVCMAVTSLSRMDKTETVPSARLATSASLPLGVIDSPEGWRPVRAWPTTLGGLAARSSTCTNDSGTQLVASCGSALRELEISAIRRSGVMAMLDGGPMTELGTSLRCWIDGGNCEKFNIEIESGPSGGITLGPPEVRSILFSFPEMMICAQAGAANARRRRTTRADRPRAGCLGDITRVR